MGSSPMHIYLYLKSFAQNSHQRDGITKAVHGLAVGLVACGMKVTVLSEGPQVAWCDMPEGYSHRCFLHETNSPSPRLSSGLKAFVEQCVTATDVMVLNGGFHLSVFAFSRFLKRQGVPYIVAPHLNYDAQMFRKTSWLKHPYWHLMEATMLKQALAIQVLDRRQTNVLRNRGILSPIIEVQNGFEGTEVVSESELTWQTDSEQPAKLFFLGRLSIHTKGLDLLLDAVGGLSKAMSSQALPQLLLKGNDVGDNGRLLEQIRHLGLEGQVALGPGDYHTPPTVLMAEHNVLCLPSRSEGFGLVALEGMLAGRVLLVPECSGIAAHVLASGCGVVVTPDVPSIQAGLQWLLSRRSQWKQMGLQGRNYALKHLQWEVIAEKAIGDYQQLISSTTLSISQGGSDFGKVDEYSAITERPTERPTVSSGVEFK
jgi:glycosyltransferase involved in cell wall biosynthesis